MKLFNIMISLTMLSLLFVRCKGDHNQTDDNDGPSTEIPRPHMAIDLDEAIALYQNYGTNRVELIETYEDSLGQVENFQATRSLTFDFEELRQYMDYVEQEAKAAGTNIKGLRVYLGQYDLEGSNYPNSETVFFNPTMKTSDGNEVSFAIKDNNGNPIPVPVGQLQELFAKGAKTPGKANLVLKLEDEDGITSLAGNHGGKRPPPSTDDEDYFDQDQ